jgi:hypothetical protein
MSLEQVKAIIRIPWGTADEDGVGIAAKPKPSSVKSYQRTCLPARIPVRITIRNSTGIAEVHIALAILLNHRGARFESSMLSEDPPPTQNPFQVHQLLWIEVLSTGKAAGGEVVWADSRPNHDGNFEFSVELRDTGNLFNVFFLRQDWEQPETAMESGPLPEPAFQRAAGNLQPDATPAPNLASAPPPSSNVSSAMPSPVGNTSSDEPMTDRLAELFKEVIQSAVRKEENAASFRLVKEVKDEVGQVQQAALESLRNEITQQVSVLEDQLLQQCRTRSEQVLSAITRTALQALSNEMEEMAGKTEERIQGIFSALVRQLEERSAKVLAEATTRLQAQVENSASGIQGAVVQRALSEIHEKQKVMMEQIQQQIGMTTEQNLVKLRGGLIRALQELSESNPNEKLAV